MADEKNDPPWGKPLTPGDMEQSGGSHEPTEEPPPEAFDEPSPEVPQEEQPAAESEGGESASDREGMDKAMAVMGIKPAGNLDPVEVPEHMRHPKYPLASTEGTKEYDPDEDDFPVNVSSQTREGEHPYQWHKGQRPHEEGWQDAVEFIDVHKGWGRNKILNGLNLGVPNNMITVYCGPSGTGKSVTIKHMIGLLYPDQGDVLVFGESVPNMVDDELFEMRKRFGLLFQDGALFGSMNIFDNVAFPLRQHTEKSEDEITDLVNGRLNEVGMLNAGNLMPNELSGGMRKRAGFARALIMNPDIVIFDEPDSGLDPVRTALLGELIQEIHGHIGGCFVIISHNILLTRRVADYIALVWKGRIVESGTAADLFDSDNQFTRQFLAGESRGPLGMD